MKSFESETGRTSQDLAGERDWQLKVGDATPTTPATPEADLVDYRIPDAGRYHGKISPDQPSGVQLMTANEKLSGSALAGAGLEDHVPTGKPPHTDSDTLQQARAEEILSGTRLSEAALVDMDKTDWRTPAPARPQRTSQRTSFWKRLLGKE